MADASSATSAIAKTIALAVARRQSADRETASGDGSSRPHLRERMPGAFPRRVIARRFLGYSRAGTRLCSHQSATIMAKYMRAVLIRGKTAMDSFGAIMASLPGINRILHCVSNAVLF